MKIEKLNDRQIRCTLTREDLESRQMKFSELAYNNTKARKLFHEVLMWASFEFGFEGMDTPLMIEAVPVSSDAVAVIITRVEELQSIQDIASEAMRNATSTDVEDASSNQTPEDISPVTDGSIARTELYAFQTLQELIHLSHALSDDVICPNSLYRNQEDGQWYLIIRQGTFPIETFLQLGTVISEYGRQQNLRPFTESFLEEHFPLLIEDNALQVLAEL